LGTLIKITYLDCAAYVQLVPHESLAALLFIDCKGETELVISVAN